MPSQNPEAVSQKRVQYTTAYTPCFNFCKMVKEITLDTGKSRGYVLLHVVEQCSDFQTGLPCDAVAWWIVINSLVS